MWRIDPKQLVTCTIKSIPKPKKATPKAKRAQSGGSRSKAASSGDDDDENDCSESSDDGNERKNKKNKKKSSNDKKKSRGRKRGGESDDKHKQKKRKKNDADQKGRARDDKKWKRIFSRERLDFVKAYHTILLRIEWNTGCFIYFLQPDVNDCK